MNASNNDFLFPQQTFRTKLYRLPTSHAIKIYQILIGHLEKYYQRPPLLESSVLIRLKIFVWLLNFRANATYHVGYPDDRQNGNIRFSHYITIETSSEQSQVTAQQPGIGHQTNENMGSQPLVPTSEISIRRALKCIIECTQKERDWSIMEFVLKELPKLLQNKAVVKGTEMDSLAIAILNLV